MKLAFYLKCVTFGLLIIKFKRFNKCFYFNEFKVQNLKFSLVKLFALVLVLL